MKYKLILLSLCLLWMSCKNSEENRKPTPTNLEEVVSYDRLNELNWILGGWSNITTEIQSYESWEIENDSLWLGISLTLKDQDTIFAERMRLFQNKGIVGLYVETLGDEPNPVVFTQVPNAEHTFTFENQQNEFPSQIIYTQPEANKLHAWVSGTIEGVPQKIDFYFTRQ